MNTTTTRTIALAAALIATTILFGLIVPMWIDFWAAGVTADFGPFIPFSALDDLDTTVSVDMGNNPTGTYGMSAFGVGADWTPTNGLDGFINEDSLFWDCNTMGNGHC